MKQIALSLLGLLITTTCQAEDSSIIAINPADNVAEIVERAPAGATFYLHTGIYRLQYARPKDGQKFIGKGEVVFNGATILSGWRNVDGYWVARGPEKRRRPSGKCRNDTPMCGHNEDLFVNGKVYLRAASLADVGPGMFYDDGLNIRIADDPTDKLTEFGVMPFAFASEAEGVLLQDIIVEKYASPAQRGAIEFQQARNWELRNVIARLNHGVGARLGPGARISGGSYSNNGQLGLGGGSGSGIVIEGVEIAYNNYAGYSPGWEAGGTKFVRVDGLVVRKACVHHNSGPGLWTDIDNINVEFVDNLVFENRGDGIKHEISYAAKIHGNTVARNGHGTLNWLWRSQILIQNSQDVEVYDNVVEVGPDYGNGISVINQNRGKGRHGPWVARNNFVHNNTIIHLGASGASGMVADHGREWFDDNSGNLFDSNTYVVPHDKRGYFEVKDGRARFSRLSEYAMEKKGKVQIAARKPLKLVCSHAR
jgi:hypothetical protein